MTNNSPLQTIFYLVKTSIVLDWRFLQLPFSWKQKVSFLCAKYAGILTNWSKKGSAQRHTTLFGRPFLYRNPYDIVVIQSLCTGYYKLKHILPPTPIVIDIGANIGQFRWLCQYLLHAKEIYSFEPIPENFEALAHNFPSPKVFPYAITMHKAPLFHIPENTMQASMNEVPNPLRSEHGVGKQIHEIPAILEHSSIDLLKIDTEGAELDTLHACEKILPRCKFILIEITGKNIEEIEVSPALTFLKTALPKSKIINQEPIIGRDGTCLAIDLLIATHA